jgi:hypothetical protein
MALSSLLSNLINFLKDWGSSILKKCGYKIVKYEDFKEETLEVNFNYPTQSSIASKKPRMAQNFIGLKNTILVMRNILRPRKISVDISSMAANFYGLKNLSHKSN